MTFHNPEFLNWLFVLPIPAILFWWMAHYVGRVRLPLNLPQLRKSSSLSGRGRYFTMALLFLFGCASLIIALAEPEMEQKKERPIYQKIDVVFLLDNSLSMRTRDILPSRMDRAREEIKNFIIHRGTANIGRMGLVSFAGSSVILSYLSKDPDTILYYLDFLQAETDPSFGTDIGSGVKNGLELIRKEQEVEQTLKPDTVIFILISDGEDHGRELRDAVAAASTIGIRVYSVGFGSQSGGYMPIGEKDGETIYLVDEEGKKILATFDESTLRFVAEASNATYYRSYSGTELYRNLNDILNRERQIIGTETVTERTPLHQWFLIAGFAALAIFLIA